MTLTTLDNQQRKPCACGCGDLAGPGKNYVHNHHVLQNEHDRFWAKVDKNGPNGCWLWTASLKPSGYGQFGFKRRPREWKVYAHRYAYEALVGPIPEGLHIDHLCRNRACVNPDHLEPVTPRENVLRGETIVAACAAKTHCVHGHPFDAENTYIRPNGTRECRTCCKERQRT